MSKYASTSQPCPSCGSSDSLAIYHDGGGYCFSKCGYVSRGKLEGRVQQRSRKLVQSSWNLEEVSNYPVADLSHRGLTREAVERYGVRQAVRPENGEADNQAIFYPAGLGGGFKRKNALTRKDMEVLGDYGGLFGQQVFPRGGRFLVVTEGEEDAIALWQAFKAQGKDYSVVSLPNGAGCGGIEKREVWDYVTSFQGVLLAFDSDEQGREGAEKFADIYSTEVKLKIAELPDGCKDAND